MTDTNWVEQAVEKVVTEVLEGRIPQLRRDLTARVLEVLGPQLGTAPESSPANLLKAISAIQAGSTQREILRSLLDHAVRYCGRAALFVIKGGAATGWQGRAFTNHEEIKDFALDVSSGLAARTLQSRIAFHGSASDMDAKFTAKFGAPGDDRVLMLPLLLKERVAALVYADPGAEAGGKMDMAALELLVVASSAWLEVAASRKQKDGGVENGSSLKTEKAKAPIAAAAAASSSSSSSYHDPFASHAPSAFAAAAAAAPPPAPIEELAPAASGIAIEAEPEPVPALESAPAEPAAAEAAAPASSPAEMSPEDAEIHRKAQRFARLLVDEIKLYNQAKVSEGRKNKDLYDRLKDDIDKSLATYQKRYGATVAASAGYFHQEILRSLAEDDTSVMGANYQP